MKCDKTGCGEQATRRGHLKDGSPWDDPTTVDLCDGHAEAYERYGLLLAWAEIDGDVVRRFYTKAL